MGGWLRTFTSDLKPGQNIAQSVTATKKEKYGFFLF
jgi:hypothetical protein